MIPVLYYHRVGPFRSGAPRKMTVSPESFRKQMDYLRRRNYTFVSLSQAMTFSRKAVAITFDDGYRDLLEHALPVLEEYRIPATFFLVAGAMGKSDWWYRGEEIILDWSDARELVRRGFSIGSHGLTHTPLDGLSPSEALNEAVESKRILEDRLGVPIQEFAYPKGRCVPEPAREAGYRDAWGTQSASGAPFRRRRFRVSGRAGLLRFAGKVLRIRMGWR